MALYIHVFRCRRCGRGLRYKSENEEPQEDWHCNPDNILNSHPKKKMKHINTNKSVAGGY